MQTAQSGTARPVMAARGLRLCAAALLGLAASASLPAPFAGVGIAAAAAEVPLPRPSPFRSAEAPADTSAGDDDAIGALIDDMGEAAAREDDDAPRASAQETVADVPVPDPAPSVPAAALNSAGLKLALKALDDDDPRAAMLAAYALPNRVDIKLVDYLVATSGSDKVPASLILEASKKLTDWPGQRLIRLRYEQAVAREKPSAAATISALGGSTPISDSATLQLARAYVATGRQKDAAALIRAFWRDQNFSRSDEKSILSEFGDLLTKGDHKARMDRLLYDERSDDALRTAGLIDANQVALAKAVIAVIKNSKSAGKALDGLPSAVKGDPLALYSRIQYLRRADKEKAAAELLVKAPRDPKVLVDPDAWWIERRLLSRAMAEAGDAKLAYRIAAGHAAESSTYQAEAEFHAGWFALEFLHDPKTAYQHFAEIEKIASMPLSLSRAEYWMGRALATAGDKAGATNHFQRAGAYPTTFYGQLALTRLGNTRLNLSRPPAASDAVRQRFASRELVQVIDHLEKVGQGDRADLFYRHLADTLTDPAEIGLLCERATRAGKQQLALQMGKTASSRGLPVDTLAFPTTAIPTKARTPRVEKSLVYAVARQESAFNPGAISRAGALGLLQLMPATAKQVARSLGMPYSKSRLTADPAYNATLGAAHLGDLVDNWNGSYVMTFAAYNAGSRRVSEWVQRHGDPRDPKVDVVNWIELIPFTETRNYVQRILENVQVYRARLGEPALAIEADLKRGKAG